MAASSLSMAAAVAVTAASYICSSPLHKKISNLSFPLSSTNFQPKTLYLKFPKLALISRSSPYRALSAAFDELSVAEDHTLAENEDEDFDDDEFDEEEEEEEEKEEEKVIRSIGVGRLYVGNLPYAITSTQLTELFGEAGRVNSVEIVYDRVTDRSRGFAFVTMGSVDDAKEAIRMYDGAQVGGRTVKVNFPEVPKGGEREVMGPKIRNSYRGFVDTPHKIYVGNLSWNVTSEGLKNVFEGQPGFLSAKVIYERDTGKSRGFGFVSFSTAEEVQSALNALNGQDVDGRPLRLNLASERAPPAPPPPAVERNTENSPE